jgi:hypothetical protein
MYIIIVFLEFKFISQQKVNLLKTIETKKILDIIQLLIYVKRTIYNKYKININIQ